MTQPLTVSPVTLHLLILLGLASAAFLQPTAYDRFGLLVTSVALNPLPDSVSLWVNQSMDLQGVRPGHRCSLEMLGILVMPYIRHETIRSSDIFISGWGSDSAPV